MGLRGCTSAAPRSDQLSRTSTLVQFEHNRLYLGPFCLGNNLRRPRHWLGHYRTVRRYILGVRYCLGLCPSAHMLGAQ